MPKLHRTNTVAWGLLKWERCCMIVVSHWSKPAWQNMASLLAVVGSGIPHSMPQGGKSYHLISKKPPLVRARVGVKKVRRAWIDAPSLSPPSQPSPARGEGEQEGYSFSEITYSSRLRLALRPFPLCQYLSDSVGEGYRLHGFQQKGINAQDGRVLGVYQRTITRAQDNRNVRTNTPQFPYQSVACHSGHGLIRDDEIKAQGGCMKGRQRVVTAGADRDGISQTD